MTNEQQNAEQSAEVGAASQPDATPNAAEATKELTKEEKKALKEKEKAAKEEAKKTEKKSDESAPIIGKGKFDEDKLLTCHMCVVDLAEYVHEAVRANIHKDAKPFIQLTDQNRMDLIQLVRTVLNHRHPTVAMVHNNINKIFNPQPNVALHQLDPLAQRLAHLIYGIVLGFKKTE